MFDVERRLVRGRVALVLFNDNLLALFVVLVD
jgi:hypothetical protein